MGTKLRKCTEMLRQYLCLGDETLADIFFSTCAKSYLMDYALLLEQNNFQKEKKGKNGKEQ